jgi:hypothetical protein
MRIFPDSVSQALFDRGGLKAVFDHARKLVVATIIVAAGFETVRRFDTIDLLSVLNPLFASYVVAGTGCALIALNFMDGLRKLATLRRHLALQGERDHREKVR